MVTKIQRWGNSQGLRITRQMLEDAHISVGDEVDVAVRQFSGACSLSGHKRVAPSTIAKLVEPSPLAKEWSR